MTVSIMDLASEISRMFASLDVVTTERDGLQSQMDLSRSRLAELKAQDTELGEQMACLSDEQTFLAAEGTRLYDRLMDEGDPLAPHMRDVLTHAMKELGGGFKRGQQEMEIVMDLLTDSGNERKALTPVFEGQSRAHLDSAVRGLDIAKEIVEMVQPVRIG